PDPLLPVRFVEHDPRRIRDRRRPSRERVERVTTLVHQHGRIGTSGATAGAALFAVAAAVSVTAPSRLNLGLTTDSPAANLVIVPVVYWAAVAVGAAAMSRVTAEPFLRTLARLSVPAFATHMLLLFAASAPRATDRAAYSTVAYW